MSSTHEIFSHFSGKARVSAADAANGYWHVPIEPKKQALFCFFDTQGRKMKFLRNCQGFKNAGERMCSLMSKIFSGAKSVRSFVDDIYITTTEEEGWTGHLAALKDMFLRLGKANVKLKQSKLQICQPAIEILGWIWESKSFSIPKARVKAVQEYKRPKSAKTIKGFVAFCGYWRKALYHYSEYCIPLTDVIKKEHKTFKWTKEAEIAFEKIKQLVCKAIAITPPMFDRKFLLSSDASLRAIGGILYQLSDEGEPLYLGCFSKCFSSAEASRSAFQRECTALIGNLLHFDYYLRFADCIRCYIDSISLFWLKHTRASNQQLLRYSLILSNYNLEVLHIGAEKKYWSADLLSRSLDLKPYDLGFKPMTTKQGDQLFSLLKLDNKKPSTTP